MVGIPQGTEAELPPVQAHHPPPGKQTPAYGLRAAGTHPTGVHSCLKILSELLRFVHFLGLYKRRDLFSIKVRVVAFRKNDF